MILAAFVFVVPALMSPAASLAVGIQADPVGAREVTYTLSHMGESYLKDSSTSAMGKHGSTPGVSEWWPMRTITYGDTVIHNSFPYGIGYNPNSASNTYNRINHAGYIMVSFYRLEMDATNIVTLATGPEQDPKIIPILHGGSNPDADDGGNVQFSWYMTYLTSADVAAIQANTHYANSYYGVTPAGVYFAGAYANDGWYFEHQGTMQLDRLAAHKFLALPGSGDLRAEFTSANAGGALNTSFAAHYDNEGNPGAIYDTYANYDFSTDPVKYFLKLDPSSTADSLVVRMWGYSWGVDALMLRYMEVTGLMNNLNVWPEDWYLNGTLTSTYGNIQSRMVTFDHITQWKDYSVYTGAWMIEPVQSDWTYSEALWMSRYNDYDAYATNYRPGKEMWAPGSNFYGEDDLYTTAQTTQGVAYWVTPRAWDLVAGEQIVVKLADAFWAIEPYKGVAAEDFAKGVGAPLKTAELMQHDYWGEMVLGHGPDASLYSSTYYDPDTKTITYTGPMTFSDDNNGMHATLEQTGSPLIVLSVSEVSHYSMRIVEAGPYVSGVPYTLEVVAQNYTGVTVADWNGTVTLSLPMGGATLGATSHAYVVGDGGVWTTTITFDGAISPVKVVSTDSGFPLDIVDEIQVDVGPAIDYGLLRVTTNPAVNGMIYVDGHWMSPWGLDWVKMSPGTYTLSFGDVPGFITPAPAEITITAGETTNYQANYGSTGSFRVMTSPAVPSTVYVNGLPRNDWGMWVDVAPGTYTVSFGAVAGYDTPAPRDVVVPAGGYADTTGVFVSNPSAPGPDPATYGLLRVTTNPAVPSMIMVDGHWMSPWGLDWVKMSPGEYTLSFTPVPGRLTPPSELFTIVAGQTTERQGVFGATGSFRVMTSPAVPSTVYVDGLPRNDWGMWVDVAPGTYTVSFGDVPGYITPAPRDVVVTAGGYSPTVGEFLPVR